MPFPRKCLGCGTLTRHGSRCPKCDGEQAAEYNSALYKRLRGVALQRDNHECQCRGCPSCDGRPCGRRATTVDHTIPKAKRRGPVTTAADLKAMCLPCNSGKRDR